MIDFDEVYRAVRLLGFFPEEELEVGHRVIYYREIYYLRNAAIAGARPLITLIASFAG